MTYEEFRKWGYVSRLSEIKCGSGKVDSAMNTNNALTQQQLSLAQQQQQQSTEDRTKSQALLQPLIDKQTALASGDRKAALEAAMPTISGMTSGLKAAEENLKNTMTPGAGLTSALANLKIQEKVAPAMAMAQQVQQAPEILGNIAQGQGAFSLQELGAALSGYSGASSTNQSSLSAATQQQASKLGLVGDIAGAAGSAASGGLLKKK